MKCPHHRIEWRVCVCGRGRGGKERLAFSEKKSVARYHSVCNVIMAALFVSEIIDVFLAGTRCFIYLFSLPNTVFFLSY